MRDDSAPIRPVEPHNCLGIHPGMTKSRYAARLANVYFLERIGTTLRDATKHTAHEELPAEIKLLLNRLDRLERKARRKKDERPRSTE